MGIITPVNSTGILIPGRENFSCIVTDSAVWGGLLCTTRFRSGLYAFRLNRLPQFLAFSFRIGTASALSSPIGLFVRLLPRSQLDEGVDTSRFDAFFKLGIYGTGCR